jgi:hypothetical protein
MKKNKNNYLRNLISYLFQIKLSVMMLLLLFPFISETLAANLINYPAPNGYAKSTVFIVTVNGQPSPVYDARINDPDNCGYTYFDFEELVHVTVTVPAGFTRVKIRPQSAGIKAKVIGNKIEFDMTSPKKLCLELNENLSYPLFIFANPIEINPPKPNDHGVTYFGPGIHDAGKIELKSNETVYVAGGAIVKGYFTALNATNIKIIGRGIMDAHENKTTMILMKDCKNVVVDGIIIVDQPEMNWTTSYWSCDSTLIKNIKIMAGDHWANDGIDIVSCQHFTVDDCFVKCYDDCVVVKALHTNRREAKDVKIMNCLLWDIHAHAIQIGPELDAPEVSSVLVKNCDLIHPNQIDKNAGSSGYFYCGTLGILNGDDCDVFNIRYEDIRIEDATAKLVTLLIMKTQYNRTKTLGKIHDIYFKNIQVVDGKFVPSEIISYGIDYFYKASDIKPGQLIENITFENLVILGKVITNTQEGGFTVCPGSNNLRFIK